MTDQTHRFKVGQIVEIMPSVQRFAAKGDYEIIHLVPVSSGDPQYRLKSAGERHDRIVGERDLTLSMQVVASVFSGC